MSIPTQALTDDTPAPQPSPLVHRTFGEPRFHNDGMVRFWDAGTQKFLGEIAAHPMAVSAVAFAPKGEYVATAGEDRTVRVWDGFSHKRVAELKSHTDRIPSLAWSPDGGLLIS